MQKYLLMYAFYVNYFHSHITITINIIIITIMKENIWMINLIEALFLSKCRLITQLKAI